MAIEPYLFLNGRAEEAIEFYRKALGAEVAMIMRYSESPDPGPEGMLPPGFENKIMHASITVEGANLMMSDGLSPEPGTFSGFSLALSTGNADQAKRWFDALCDGGQVTMPFDKTFFAEQFGMVTDRFGVGWMVLVPSPDYA